MWLNYGQISPIPSAQLAGSGDGELLGLEAQSLQARGHAGR